MHIIYIKSMYIFYNLLFFTESFNAIYIGPKNGDEKSVPLVVWPHGGPHSAFGNNLFMEGAMFLSFGETHSR